MSLSRSRFRGLLLTGLAKLELLLELLKRRLAPAPVVLFRDVTAPWLASALTLAAELELAERLDRGVDQIERLASELDLPLEALRRYLHVLAAHGYFKLSASGQLSHTRLSLALRQRTGGAFAALQGSSWYRQAFEAGTVLQGWREGRTPFEVAEDQPFFEYLSANARAGQLFATAMTNVTRFCAPYLVEAIPLRPGERYLDVGGGDGELARALLSRYPGSEVAILDRTSAASDLPFLRGDFFVSVPRGYDGFCLKNVLHDWSDEQALEILGRCREAAVSRGRLFLVECLLPEALARPQFFLNSAATHALDWNVWLTLSGRERSETDYRSLLARSGWQWTATRGTATPYAVLEAEAR